MRSRIFAQAAFILVACLMVGPGRAEIVREDGVKSIAGVLRYGFQETAQWTFKSSGDEILFADLDAEIYRTKGGHEPAVSSDTGGGCGGEEGPVLFYIEVWSGTERLCRADKPAPPPGWMRDPRMACVLPPSGHPATTLWS
jgi:hypothetical protein